MTTSFSTKELCSPLKPSDSTVQLYKLWPSHQTTFLCGGLCVCGPQPWAPIWTSVPIMLGFLLYTVLPAVDIWQAVSPWLAIATVMLFISTMTGLFLAAYSDPGIMPRRSIVELMDQMDATPDGCCSEMDDRVGGGPLRYCSTCQLYRDSTTTSHCRVCNNCVLGFDHHCIFLNNCIGGRNYPFFMTFVVSVTLYAAIVMIQFIIWTSIVDDESATTGISIGIKAKPDLAILARVMALLCLICLVSLVLFLGFHLCLLAKGITTKQVIRHREHLSPRSKCSPLFTRQPPLFDARMKIPKTFRNDVV